MSQNHLNTNRVACGDGNSSTLSNFQKSFQRRLSLNSLSIQSKTPVRSSLNSTKKVLDIQIDKSSDLVNIKNGYFSYNGKKSTTKNCDTNVIDNNVVKTNISTSPRIIVNAKNCVQRSPKRAVVINKTIKSSLGLNKEKFSMKNTQSSNYNSNVQIKENLNSQGQLSTQSVQHFSNLSEIEGKNSKQRIKTILLNEDEVLKQKDINIQMKYNLKRSSVQGFKSDDDLFSSHDFKPQAITERRRLSQTDVQNEILMIQMKQKEREQNLIEQFNKLKQQAKETIMANSQLSQTQPNYILNQDYEKRMERFENIIETLLESQRTSSQQYPLIQERNLSQPCQQRSQTQLMHDAFNLTSLKNNTNFKQSLEGSATLNNQNILPQTIKISNQQLESIYKSGTGILSQIHQFGTLPQNKLSLNLNSFSQQSQTVFNANQATLQQRHVVNANEELSNACSSASTTQDHRFTDQNKSDNNQQKSQQNNTQILDQTISRKDKKQIKPIQITVNANQLENYDEGTSDEILRQEILSTKFNPSKQQKQQISQFFGLSNKNSRDMKGFLETLQSAEEITSRSYTNNDELISLRDKLSSYRDQIKQTENQYFHGKDTQLGEQKQILKALETIIAKMDQNLGGEPQNYLTNQKYIVLMEDENIYDCSVDKTKIVLDSLQTPKDMQNEKIILISSCSTHKGADIVDNTILNTSTKQSHQQIKTCNKSGFQVKHSRYRSTVNQYNLEPITNFSIPVETYEECDKGWLSEIKHLKALLGSLAEQQANVRGNNMVTSQESKTKKSKDQTSQNQCIIM